MLLLVNVHVSSHVAVHVSLIIDDVCLVPLNVNVTTGSHVPFLPTGIRSSTRCSVTSSGYDSSILTDISARKVVGIVIDKFIVPAASLVVGKVNGHHFNVSSTGSSATGSTTSPIGSAAENRFQSNTVIRIDDILLLFKSSVTYSTVINVSTTDDMNV